ncbi:MAG: sodium:calcium antiporter, partial [Bacteroidetes bacterium]
LTIVAFGTSAPELTVSIYASLSGSTEIAIGNVVGSNIFNTLLILGVAAVIYPVTVQSNSVWIEIPLSLLAAVVLGVCANDMLIDGAEKSMISRIDGIVLLGFFAVFMYYTFYSAKNGAEPPVSDKESMPIWKIVVFVVFGLVGLVAGGMLMVEGASAIAKSFGISESIIGLTIVAAGTSMPELATSAAAAYKKNSDIAIGNVVGSNIFNVFFILGTSATISPLPYQPKTSNVDVMLAVVSSILLFAFVFIGKGRKINKVEGGIFISLYIIYVAYLISTQG